MAEKKREDMKKKKDRGFIKFIKGIFDKKFHLTLCSLTKRSF